MKNFTPFKKLVPGLIFFFFCVNASVCQYELLTAIKINEQLEKYPPLQSGELFNAINDKLLPYCTGCPAGSNIFHYFIDRNNNPFLSQVFSSYNVPRTISPIASPRYKSGALNEKGQINFTNIALGMTDFLIERSKSELSLAFFRRFKEELSDEKIKDLGILFPQTLGILNVLGNEIYQFDHYIGSLRTAFDKDLRMLLENSKDYILKKGFTGKPKYTLFSALEFAGWVKSNKHPGEIIDLLAKSSNLNQLSIVERNFKDVFNALKFISLISASLRNNDPDRPQYWTEDDNIHELGNERTLKIYLGLLYERSKQEPYLSISIGIQSLNVFLKSIGDGWESSSEKLRKIREFVVALGSKTQAITKSVEILIEVSKRVKADTSLSTKSKQKELFNASLDVFYSLVEFTSSTGTLNSIPGFTFNISEKVLHPIETGGELALHLAHRQFAGAIVKWVELIKLINTNLSDLDGQIFQRVLKYGTFMANIVEAESPESIRQAIETVALPPGSYTIKRQSAFNISLNGYLGALGGWEVIKGVDNGKINTIGITAPIGLSFSWGNLFSNKRPWSLGFSIPVLDMGAVASYRLGNSGDSVNSAETAPTIQLKHLFAPGCIFELGVGPTPLTLGFGVQFGPRLRKIHNIKDGDEVGDSYHRIGASLKVDIPILNLYTSASKLSKIKEDKVKKKKC